MMEANKKRIDELTEAFRNKYGDAQTLALGLSVTNRMLINKGICTEEELFSLFVDQTEKRIKNGFTLRSEVQEDKKMGITQRIDYVDVPDLNEAAQEVYDKFRIGIGLNNGEMWKWLIGATGEDSAGNGYLTDEECLVIDNALKEYDFEDGDCVSLCYSW